VLACAGAGRGLNGARGRKGVAMRIVVAAVLYFAIVFAVGLALGPIRVLWLEPRLGVTLAVLCETPFLLAAMIFAARWVPRKTGLGNDLAPLALMGIGALALQQAADLGVGIWLRGLAPGQQYAGLATPAGAVYLALLVVFAVLPAALNAGRRHT